MKVFVSYKRGDDDGERLLSLLQKELPFATVLSDRLLTIGGEWRRGLWKLIDRCVIFVVLMSAKAADSVEVKEEVRRAIDRPGRTIEKNPVIVLVRVNYNAPLDGFPRNLNDIQQLTWTGEQDNQRVLAEIRRQVVKAWIPRLCWAAAALIVLALLVYLFVIAPLGNIRRLPSAPTLSAAKKYRDAASRVGWSSRAGVAYAGYLHRWSKGHLANARKNVDQGKVPEGLVLAALVARENGGKLDRTFLKDYEEGHYRLLKQTLRTGSTLGAGLAVSSDGTQIAAGNALWNVASRTRCSLGADAINVVAFGPRGLYTGGNEHVLAWTVCRPGAQLAVSDEMEDLEDRVQYLAVAPDDAVAFVMRKGRYVLLQEGGTSAPALKHSEPVRSIAFSKDGSLLITTSGAMLNVWNRREPRSAPKQIDTGIPLRGASVKGDYAAVAGPRSVKVWRWRPAIQFQYEIPSGVPIRAVALSDQPGLVAVVTDEGVLLEQISEDAFRLGAIQSVASDVVFSDVGRELVIKRVDAIEIWAPDTTPTPMDAPPPNDPFDDWSRKFALTVDENGHVAPIPFKQQEP